MLQIIREKLSKKIIIKKNTILRNVVRVDCKLTRPQAIDQYLSIRFIAKRFPSHLAATT